MARYQLIGSSTSPYVRRLRLLLADTPYEFERLANMYGAEEDAKLTRLNPLKRVPVLVIDGQPLWESRVIANHLRTSLGRGPLTLAEENVVSAIDTLQDMLIQKFLMKKFSHPILETNEYFQRHAERQRQMLTFLKRELAKGLLDRWDYPAMSLYCLLDWAKFRETLGADELGGYFADFMRTHQGQAAVASTDPRQG